MKKFIVSFLVFSITAGLALIHPLSAFAAQDNPDAQKGAKKAAPAQAARPAAHAPVAHAPAARAPIAHVPAARAPVAHAAVVRSPVAKAPSAPAHVARQQPVNPAGNQAAVTHAAANPAFQKRVATNKPAGTAPANAQAVQSRGTHAGRTANTNNTQVAGAPQSAAGANGGGQYTRANNYGGRWTSGNNHPDWNQGGVNNWDGHQYRWYDGGWLMVDGGFWPVPVYQGGGSMMAGAQQQLAADGYYNGPIDGIPGPGTRQAIANYQSANNLPVTGHLNIPTQQSLGLD